MSEPTRRLAVLGDSDSVAATRSAASAAGVRLVDPSEADAIVAVGEAALRDAMRTMARADSPSIPVLPIGTGRHAVAADVGGDQTDTVVEDLAASEPVSDAFSRIAHPVLSVDRGGDGRDRFAAADVAFVTGEPARISEYGIAFSDDDSASVRADGVVVATPLGSDGYAAAAGGPLVSPGGGLAVIPVAPFTTHPDTWIASDGVRVTVKREEEPVALIVDGARQGTVEPHRAVRIEVATTVDLLSPTAE